MSDDPFSEPDDDRTVIRPRPGGRQPSAAPARPPPQPAAPPPLPPAAPALQPAPLPAVDPAAPPAISVSPLAACASPLLQLLARLGMMRRPPDPEALRDRVLADLRTFERQAREAEIPMEQVRPAHYALCASIDDVVLNTPWGAASAWADRTLVATFHHGARGTDQFFDQLRQMRRTPDQFLPVLELMHLCLSLGFMGRYRQSSSDELEQVRAQAHAALSSQRPPAEAELSRRWRGVTAPYRPARGGVPVWVALAASAAVCGGLLVWASTSLNAASDLVQAQALASPPARMPQVTRAAIVQPVPPPPPPPEPTVLDRLKTTLQPDIDRGTVALLGTPATPVIRIADRGMFAQGSAAVQKPALPLLERVGAALRSETGALRVVGYTDNQPVRTVQFPSNFQLSAARANAVRAIVAARLDTPARITAEGRGDADPIAPNTTPEGREQNRRIEIVLRRQD